jgi:protein-tyrosine phosphatase
MSEGLKQKIQEKAKTAGEIVNELLNERQRNFNNFKKIRENKWVLVSVAQQEIDKEKEIYHVLWEKYDNLNELFQSLTTLACDYYDDTERERGLLKQKLREFWKWLEQKAWRGVSSEVIDEFGERFEELLK